MAMRARGGGVNPNRPRRAIVGRVYEPFKPVSEWAQQDDYDSLLVYLPGFEREFIKVTTEDPNILRVRGERLVSGNKWSRFQEDFQVPQNCKMTGIRAKFDSGILTITMPRKIIDPPTTTTTTVATPKAKEPIKSAKQDKDSENALPSSPKQEKDSANASSSSAIKNGDEATKKDELKRVLEASEKPTRPNQTTLDATLLPQPPFTNRFEAKEKPTRPNQTTLGSTPLPQPPSADRFEAKKKPTRPNQTTLGSTPLPQPPSADRFEAKEKPTRPNQTTLDATLLPQPPMVNPNGSKPLLPSLGKPNDQGKTNEIKPLDQANEKEPITEKIAQIKKRDSELKNKEVNKMEEFKRLVKGMKEERELLVNMGVAVLVIVALGAYVSYTIGSSSKGN